MDLTGSGVTESEWAGEGEASEEADCIMCVCVCVRACVCVCVCERERSQHFSRSISSALTSAGSWRLLVDGGRS